MSTKNLLWVEDDAHLLYDMVVPLKNEGWKIDIVDNFDAAKEKISDNKNSYDIILLDILLPSGIGFIPSIEEMDFIKNNMYGLKLLDFISKNKKTPVLVFSVVSDTPILEKIHEYDDIVKGVITKGHIRPSQLKEKIIEIVEEN